MNKNNDILNDLFSRMPEEELPQSFRINVMRKIEMETERIRIQSERWGWTIVIITSLLIAALAVVSILYIGIPKISLPIPDLTMLPFYFYIGMLALVLLGSDYLFRKHFRKKQFTHKDKQQEADPISLT
ncbi:hypothetical protein [Parabacteroides sp. AM08-6]|uniref:hypothetical protein n=1 Tax=Parabacteroides sp. AM08-6 TaxID=2292053 RepID=UPI000F00D081|nr:hypothetical protein [Parabacteroides sp. AM08-6]RHJ80007.1 hypothetical protein DW103_12915 [Parabacteroides sp. AM08-6]